MHNEAYSSTLAPMSYSAAVAGASGYAGGEVLRLLASHPDVHVKTVTAHSQAGQRLDQVQPHLHSLASMPLHPTTPEVLSGHDVVVLALPHGASAPVAQALAISDPDVLVLDIGADHRLESARAWTDFYGTEHAGVWPYGLPELPGRRVGLSDARRVAVPGCYPTASLLALVPGYSAGLLEPEDVVIVAASGVSGAGRAAKAHLLGAETMGAMSPYGVGGSHRHIPEIEQGLGWAAGRHVQVSFTPTLAPMPRGILATATARLTPGTDAASVRAAWEAAYGEEPFVHLLPEGRWPSTGAVIGSNHVQVQVAVDERAGRVVACCAIDNLTKGTAGAAVQSMNIALGLEETTGLEQEGLAP